MTVVKGLREALVVVVAAAAFAAVVAAFWSATAGGGFTGRFGAVLVVVGALLAVTGDLTLSKIGSMEARTVFGRAPEREDAGGGRVLTGVGIFLFVAVPLIVVGTLLTT